MNNKNIIKDISLTFLGIGLIALGFIINKNNLSPNKMINIISYISIAIGCGFFGHFMKNIIKRFFRAFYEKYHQAFFSKK